MRPPSNRSAVVSTILAVSLALAAGSGAALAQAEQAGEPPRARIVVPPPTPAEFKAPSAPKSLAMEIPEARAKTIGGPMPATFTFAASVAKVAIIDSGFAGIEEWLDAHPKEKSQTHYVTDPDFSASDEAEHGFLVYRTARLVLSEADLYLYKVQNSSEIIRALDDAGSKGVPIANISLGIPSDFEIAERGATEEFIATLDRVLKKREIFAFVAIGNKRGHVHSFLSADRDGNGYVDFSDSAKQPRRRDALRTVVQGGNNVIYATWDTQHYPQADYELELTGPKGRRIATGRADPKNAGYIKLEYKSSQMAGAYVRLKRLSGPRKGVFIRLLLDGPTGHSEDFNGLQTALTYTYWENPFLVYVGALGKTKTGTLTPTPFSDIGTGADGKLYPHILGPGQILLDGKEITGTSFASPFLTAIYGLAVGFNIKNILERTSSHALLDPGVAPHERSRWGVPEGWKVFFQLGKIVGKSKVEDVSHTIDGDDLVLRFHVTRCCMEGMTWNISAYLFDPETKKIVHYPGTQEPLGTWIRLRSDAADYLRHPVEVRIPLKGGAEALKGKTVQVAFGHSPFAWRGVNRSARGFNEQPAYRIDF